MSFVSPRAWYIGKLAIVSFSIFLTGYYLFSSSSIIRTDHYGIYNGADNGKKSKFVDSVMASEIDGPYNNQSLAALCQTTAWTTGLIFRCESPQGGVANVRNVILNCIRYTILAGATGFVLPEILLPIDTLAKKSTPVPLSHFFDVPFLTSTLRTTCPQIKLYTHINDLFDLPSTAHPVPITPSLISTAPLLLNAILSNPSNWTAEFRNVLNASHPVPPTGEKPVLVNLKAPIMEFPLSYDPAAFVASFGKILRFREDVRRLAGSALFALERKHSLGLQFPREGGIQKSVFIGAHLRTGADAKAAGWTPSAIQIGNYLAAAKEHNLHVMFVSANDPVGLNELIDAAAASTPASPAQNATGEIHVETVSTLLGGPLAPGTFIRPPAAGFENDWMEYQSLAWDQQLLIDYEILLRSSIFVGTWESTFSWGIGGRRATVGGWKVDFDLTKEGEEKKTGGGDGKGAVMGEGDVPSLRDGRVVSRGEGVVGRDEGEGEGRGMVWNGKEERSSRTLRERDAKVGEWSWRDGREGGRSTVFGPRGEGRRVRGSLWP